MWQDEWVAGRRARAKSGPFLVKASERWVPGSKLRRFSRTSGKLIIPREPAGLAPASEPDRLA